jgi:hypothetical protein
VHQLPRSCNVCYLPAARRVGLQSPQGVSKGHKPSRRQALPQSRPILLLRILLSLMVHSCVCTMIMLQWLYCHLYAVYQRFLFYKGWYFNSASQRLHAQHTTILLLYLLYSIKLCGRLLLPPLPLLAVAGL